MNNSYSRAQSGTSSQYQNEIKSCEHALLEIIRKKLGIVVHEHQKNDLFKTVLNACSKYNHSPLEYVDLLNKANNNSPLLEDLIVGITIGETYFFRDKAQMETLANNILPNMIKKKRDQGDLSLRIWSAGCSTGEEIYSIMMLLWTMLPDIEQWRLNFLATDINTNALHKAMVGAYSQWSMRALPEAYIKRFFRKENNEYLLTSQIIDRVSFAYLNLNENCYPSLFNGTHAQDLILCRNVLIYFDNESISRLMKKLAASLVQGGCLMLGASDPYITKETSLKFDSQNKIFISMPKGLDSTLTPKEKVTPLLKTKVKKNYRMTKNRLPPMLIAEKKSTKLIDENYINTLLDQEHWQAVLDEIGPLSETEQKSIFLFSAKANSLANLGKLEPALKLFKEILKLDPTNKEIYFTYALTLAELNRLDEAEQAFRKMLYLDRHFVMGHFQLGFLLLRKKKYNEGLKSLRNALVIVQTKDPTQLVPGFQELRYDQFGEILKHEIELHEQEKYHGTKK